MRRLLLFAPCTLLLLACGGASRAPQTGVASAASPAPRVTTITWSFWGDAQEASIDQRIIGLFESEHPEIHVESRWATYGDYLNALATWRADGQAPDVSFLYDIPAFAAQGLLADLKPMIAEHAYDLGDFYPNLLDQFRYQGDLYGLPRDNDTKVIFYNKALFDAAGVPYPQPNWTWADLRAAAIALNAAGAGRWYGFAFEPQDWWKLWVWQNGGAVFDNQNNPQHLTLDTPAALGALDFLRGLIYDDRVTPPRDELASSDTISDLFAHSQVAMAFGNHALVPTFAATQGLHWGAVGLPREQVAANYAGGAGYVISATSQHKEAAWTFLTWLESTKGEAIFTESGLIVPSRRSVGASNLFLHEGVPAGGSVSDAVATGRVFIAETEHGHGQPAFSGSTAIMNAIDAGLEPIWSQNAAPAAVVQALTPQIDALLKERQ